MIDQCDEHTVAVIDTARSQAQQLGHDYIGTEHVLLALTIHRDQLPEPVIQLLPTQDQVRDALAAVLESCPGGATPLDLPLRWKVHDQVRACFD